MAEPLFVMAVRPGWLWWDWAKVKAEEDACATFDSLLGERDFVMKSGDVVTIRVRKKAMLSNGERLTMSRLVSAACDWADLPWRWS